MRGKLGVLHPSFFAVVLFLWRGSVGDSVSHANPRHGFKKRSRVKLSFSSSANETDRNEFKQSYYTTSS